MAKEDTRTHETGVEATRIWYRNWGGITAGAIKYKDPYGGGVDREDAERDPIYVYLGGHQPEPLADALTELERFRSQKAAQEKVESTRLENVSRRLEEAEGHIEALIDRRKGWRFWKRLRRQGTPGTPR